MSENVPLPRRVLMTADTVGGVWTYAVELARGLAENGVEVALATMGEPLNGLQREKVDRIPHALSRLIADPDRRSSLAAGSRARALQLTADRMVEAYLSAYGEVLAERSATLDDTGDFPAQVAV